MLPHVDEFRPVHNLNSLRELVATAVATRTPRSAGGWRHDAPTPRNSEDILATAAALARGRRTGRDRHRGRDLGQQPAPGRARAWRSPPRAGWPARVSGGCIEGAVADAAKQTMATGTPQLLDFGVSDERAWEVGLACGGKVKVFVETLA